jgi:hypothetical protein
MAAGVTSRHGETTQHARLKQLAFIWAQTHGFSACAMEVTLPRCRYRADVAGYRSAPKQIGSTAVFECKQALCDLRRDNCHSESARKRLEAICNRRQVLETRLRTQKLIRYRCANLFFIVLPEQLFRESEVPVGWGALVESNDALMLARKPIRHESTAANRLHILHRIAVAGTRNLNRELSLDWHEQIVAGHFFGLRQAEQK